MAAKTKAEQDDNAVKSEKKEKNRKPLLIILIVVVLLLLVAAAAAAIFLLGDRLPFITRDGSAEVVEVETPPRYVYPMKEFQVNLADSGTRRFLRTTFELAYNEKSLAKEIEARESELRSHIISILRSKFAVDLDEPGGMKSLEEELIEMLNSVLQSGEIEAIYYKEFIFQ